MKKVHKSPIINSFLTQYPEDSWDLCIESLVNFAISTIEKKYPFGLTVQQLAALPSLFPASPQPQKQYKKLSKSKGSHRPMGSTQTLKVPVRSSVKVHKRPTTEKQSSSSAKRQERKPSPIPTPVQEPTLRPYQAPQTPATSPSKLVKLAEDFLSNPLTNYFSPESQAASSFFSTDSRFMSSIDLHSPVHSYT